MLGGAEFEGGALARRRRIDGAALAFLFAFSAVAVAGYGLYGLHPDRLPSSELALRIYSVSFSAFAQLHIVVAAGVLFGILGLRLGAAWLPAFVAVTLVAFTAEHVGTGYGFPFGGYSYTGLLGPKVGGRVPALIPISWFLMALPSWVLARAALGARAPAAPRLFLAALWLVAWDLALDPAMSFLAPYWRWEEAGPYYGMPWLNLVGWAATGLALMAILELLATRSGWHRLDVRWMAGYYAAMVAMPLGMLAAAGAWTAVLTTAAAIAALGGMSALAYSIVSGGERATAPVGAVEA